ncbi:MAG: ester cyclase [Pyrinomonadaceae bacterium]
MVDGYQTLLHKWFDQVWNMKNAGAIREMLDEDSVHYGLSGPGAGAVRGFEEFEKFHREFITAFPDLHVEVEDVISEGDKLAGRYTVTGRQDGQLQGAPETKKKVLFNGFGMCTTKDGKFVEVWNSVDFPKMAYDLDPNTPDVE